jgi:hypothetical protein
VSDATALYEVCWNDAIDSLNNYIGLIISLRYTVSIKHVYCLNFDGRIFKN